MMKQKIVFVSGGSRGLGKEILKTFKTNSWITISCSRQPGENISTDNELWYQCDLSDPDAVAAMFCEIRKKVSHIDLIVNNAAIAGASMPGTEGAIETWERTLKTNLSGPFFVIHYAMPLLKAGSLILNISSVLGHKGVPDQAAYCAAKHGLIGMTRSMALAMAPSGINVNAICPGWLETDMARQRSKELQLSISELAAQVPKGQMTDIREIADLVFFMGSGHLRNMTGQSIIIDGGMLA